MTPPKKRDKVKVKSWAHSAWNIIRDGNKVLGRARYQIELTDEAVGYEFSPKIEVILPQSGNGR